ncbi:hypothetical protein SRB5_43900 [Streptomyces sp. RB5]|uniref:Lipoprotein n=1 Tax=Streptomyces smaragdinus TaxID=2585196 RepID=A0A7K0CL67_9ACTN|nr:hypothetical protein [Streptomyces smaragdinus]MQY14228.1 hypothetical protein [Streptomyces smaragdinus]
MSGDVALDTLPPQRSRRVALGAAALVSLGACSEVEDDDCPDGERSVQVEGKAEAVCVPEETPRRYDDYPKR